MYDAGLARIRRALTMLFWGTLATFLGGAPYVGVTVATLGWVAVAIALTAYRIARLQGYSMPALAAVFTLAQPLVESLQRVDVVGVDGAKGHLCPIG